MRTGVTVGQRISAGMVGVLILTGGMVACKPTEGPDAHVVSCKSRIGTEPCFNIEPALNRGGDAPVIAIIGSGQKKVDSRIPTCGSDYVQPCGEINAKDAAWLDLYAPQGFLGTLGITY